MELILTNITYDCSVIKLREHQVQMNISKVSQVCVDFFLSNTGTEKFKRKDHKTQNKKLSGLTEL